MNAKDAIDLLDKCGSCDILHGNEGLVIRALRLLAAAEGGEGLTVPAHMRLRPDHVGVYDEVVLASDYYALAARVRELQERAEKAERRAERLQAKVDSLMLEYCPDEMTPEQLAEWEKHQRAVPAEFKGE